MGIKKLCAIYVSDRGEEFEVDEMADSHLINVITHHNTQLATLTDMSENLFVNDRITALRATVTALQTVLYTRDPSKNPSSSNVRY